MAPLLCALLCALLIGCTESDAPTTPVPPPERTATAAGATRAPDATGTPADTQTPAAAETPGAPASAAWPPESAVPALDAAVEALRTGDGDALLALVEQATARCTTAMGAGGPPKCPAGVADGTAIEYFPYFECDGWGSQEGALDRLGDESTYALAILRYDPPVAGRVTDDPVLTHALVLARAGFGNAGAAGDARLLTTLVFDDAAIREITGDCGAYSQDSFEDGELPDFDEHADVLWRAFEG